MEPEEKDLENFMAFKKFNKEQMDYVLENKEEVEKMRYVCIADDRELRPKFGSDKNVLPTYVMDFWKQMIYNFKLILFHFILFS